MVDPATTAGLALAIVPLMISVIENYRNIFQPFVIFTKRYREEVQTIHHTLLVQKAHFDNECHFLLESVTDHGNDMVHSLEHWSWQDQGLEDKLKTRLEENYDACVAALRLINRSLTSIMEATCTLDILLEKRQHGRIDKEWVKRLRQRNKISFRKEQFDKMIKELENSIDNLHKIRKGVERIKVGKKRTTTGSTVPIASFRTVQYASCRLYEALSSVWRCGTPQEHCANLALDDDAGHVSSQPTFVRFNLAWKCPIQDPSSAGAHEKPLRLSVEAYSEDPSIATGDPQPPSTQQALEKTLSAVLRPKSTQSVSFSSNSANPISQQSSTPSASLQDLCMIPNLCQHLGQRANTTGSVCCVGFLQKTKTFKHIVYTPNDCSASCVGTTTLEDALNVAKAHSKQIPLPEKANLSKSLARAVLRFHSTPWLAEGWTSRDVVFFGISDPLQDPLSSPYLRAGVSTSSITTTRQLLGATGGIGSGGVSNKQALINLGVMLVELAYDAPLQELVLPEDDQGDSKTLIRAARRLGGRSKRDIAPGYGAAVELCFEGAAGASYDLKDLQVQEEFYHKVVLKLRKFADAVHSD